MFITAAVNLDHTTIESPAGIERIINRDQWLIVGLSPTRLFVYRSIALPVTDEWYQPVIDLIGDTEPLTRSTISDPGMMFGRAEHVIYAI